MLCMQRPWTGRQDRAGSSSPIPPWPLTNALTQQASLVSMFLSLSPTSLPKTVAQWAGEPAIYLKEKCPEYRTNFFLSKTFSFSTCRLRSDRNFMCFHIITFMTSFNKLKQFSQSSKLDNCQYNFIAEWIWLSLFLLWKRDIQFSVCMFKGEYRVELALSRTFFFLSNASLCNYFAKWCVSWFV